MNGGGELTLSGTNSYGGGTVVDAGKLTVINGDSLPDGGSLTVAAGGVLLFDPMAPAEPAVVSAAASPLAAVPEPGTLALLLAALTAGLGVWRRRTLIMAHRSRSDYNISTRSWPVGGPV